MAEEERNNGGSYFVDRNSKRSHGRFMIVKSHFLPGYSKAHKHTPDEALSYAIESRIEKIKELQAEIKLLSGLSFDEADPALNIGD